AFRVRAPRRAADGWRDTGRRRAACRAAAARIRASSGRRTPGGRTALFVPCGRSTMRLPSRCVVGGYTRSVRLRVVIAGLRLLALAFASFVPLASGCLAFAATGSPASTVGTTAPDAPSAAPAMTGTTPPVDARSPDEAAPPKMPPVDAPSPDEAAGPGTPPIGAPGAAEAEETPAVGARAPEPTAVPRAPDWGPLEMLGATIPPGEAKRLRFESLDSFTAGLWAARGVAPGPTLCVTAGVHGDELNGIAIARALVDETDPRETAGTLIVVPIVNAYGFRNGSRYLPDRRDLNRYFPGRRNGSAAARIAYQFFEQVVRRCDALVDLHTGSLNRANLPQIRDRKSTRL